MTETMKIEFPSYMREQFEVALEKVNKKFRKIKGAIDVSVLEENEYKKNVGQNGSLEPIWVEFTEMSVSLPGSVKKKGFEFVGTVSKKDGMKTIFAPNGENLSDIDIMSCDHCGHNRARNHVYVFNKNDKRFLVASKCVENYFGIEVFKALNIFKGFMESFASQWEEDYRGSRTAYGHGRNAVIAATLGAFSASNIYSKGDYYNGVPSTADKVKAILSNSVCVASKEDMERVDKLLVSTYETLDATASNFNSNVVSAVFSGVPVLRDFIPMKGIGLLVWAIYNALNKGATAKAPKAVNAHVGEVGKKITVKNAVAKSFREMGSFSYYGPTSYLITFDTPEGQVKTFSTNSDLTALHVGDQVDLTGKVKSHEDWKGFSSTMLNYTKMIPDSYKEATVN